MIVEKKTSPSTALKVPQPALQRGEILSQKFFTCLHCTFFHLLGSGFLETGKAAHLATGPKISSTPSMLYNLEKNYNVINMIMRINNVFCGNTVD